MKYEHELVAKAIARLRGGTAEYSASRQRWYVVSPLPDGKRQIEVIEPTSVDTAVEREIIRKKTEERLNPPVPLKFKPHGLYGAKVLRPETSVLPLKSIT